MRHSPLPCALTLLLSLSSACAGKGGGDDSGGSAVTHGACPELLACADALGQPSLAATLGDDGSCWDQSESDQALCIQQCAEALADYDEGFPGEAWCNGMIADGSCATTPSGTGAAEGDVAEDFALTDAYGATIHLYDFCGDAVLLLVGAMWDGGTQAMARQDLADFLESYGDQGFVPIVLLAENEDYEAPSEDDLADFLSSSGLDAPVLADPDFAVGSSYMTGPLPSLTLLGPGAEIRLVDQSSVAASDIEAALP